MALKHIQKNLIYGLANSVAFLFQMFTSVSVLLLIGQSRKTEGTERLCFETPWTLGAEVESWSGLFFNETGRLFQNRGYLIKDNNYPV